MIESLNSFIITLATVIIFISAVELIFPDNSFKKYQSFVLGLIVLAVILTPIIKIFTSTENLGDEVKTVLEEIEEDSNEKKVYTENKNGQYVIKSLESNCESLLKMKFSNKDFEAKIEGKVDFSSYKADISRVIVEVKDEGTLGDIQVGDNIDVEIKDNQLTTEIKEVLGAELKIDKKLIMVIEK